ncbi:Run domain Beclin-1 interacting and cysteine-rich containing protein [Orchesella cincta]|uniref:Run domain Beclin-1 interacting and cysteine-rich containing protein n=1 Tax=Orchesella cincta TaxID=48709 RepID=A0A1D2MRA0_ORCCI|nr:Run domain Beclin-1 interacting and cysteine-rich containing protein [Orchesella cincta]
MEIYSQPSFAAFDTWLEESLNDFSILTVLKKRRRDHDLQDLYYEWAFLRDQALFQALIDILTVLSTRDVAPLFKIMAMEANLSVSQPQVKTMPLSGDPLLASLLATGNTIDDERVAATSPAINIPSSSRRTSIRDSLDPVDTKIVFQAKQTAVIDKTPKIRTSIPSFSYSYTSPVSSPPLDRVQSESLSTLSVPETSSILQLPGMKTSASSGSESVLLSPSLLSRRKSSSDESKISKKRTGWTESFLESDGLLLPPLIGHFPIPQKGQTLTSFLSSLSDNLPDLDRENAHFNVSEALISAFERIKIQKFQEKAKTDQHDTGDEDVFGTVNKNASETVDHPDHPGPSSKSPRRHRHFRRDDPANAFTETEESEMEYWRTSRRPPPYLRKKPRGNVGSDGQGIASQTSSSLTSSEDDDFLSSSFSAENVAFNLLRNSKISDKQLPPASELQWLVSEREAPQALLPLPKVKSLSESESDFSGSANESSIGKIDNHIRLRGNLDWAPPRPQIIFTVHPPASLNLLIKTQRCRCAGCGTKVDVKYAATFRYCQYLGRYFCTGCHTGKKARLPQMIIHQWDFSPHPVSNFSATLLEKLQSDPVYNILAINKNIYKKVKLNNFRNYRIQLGTLKEYIENCKSANFLQKELDKFPQYYASDVDLYSLEDLVHLRFSSGLPMKTKDFVTEAVKHVLHCELCKGLGFICEICNRNETLFPFQINRVSRCSQCASCFHLKCFNPGGNSCPRCLRISARRNNLDVHAAVIPESTDSLNVAC